MKAGPICLFAILVCVCAATAQRGFDVSGLWKGTIKIPLGEDLQGEYYFTQSGLIVEGYLKMTSVNGEDSSKYKVSGAIKNGIVHIQGTVLEYSTTRACLAVMELKYSKEGTQEKLTGVWKGDFRLTTCLPGVSGKVEVAKATGLTQPNLMLVSDPQKSGMSEIAADDETGNALIEELGRRKFFALIIGINDYADDGLHDLDHPVADAAELNRVLQEYYTFNKENIHVLANPTRTAIIESFDALNEKITARDHLLVFYAGHGIWDEGLNQGFWLPADAKMTSKAQWISNSTIRDYIGGIQSKHTLLITDACFSGSIFKERSAIFNNSRAILEMYKLPSRKAMTSGALKTVPDKSVFITYLLKYLINHDQPLLSTEELFRTFKIAVINNSPNGQVPQYGPIGQAGDEGGDFIFLRRLP
jgi:hypothetical protein